MSGDEGPGLVFQVFNEIGIIEQLSRTVLEAQLPEGLIAPHFTVLNHLIRVQDGQTPMTMARAFQVPKTSITHTLKVLEGRGLVRLRPNPDDGRSKQVWITAEGRALREGVIARLGPQLGWLVTAFGQDRFAEMLPHLRALRVFLDENRDAQPQRRGEPAIKAL